MAEAVHELDEQKGTTGNAGPPSGVPKMDASNSWSVNTSDAIEYFYQTSVDNYLSANDELMSANFTACFESVWCLIVKAVKRVDDCRECLSVSLAMRCDERDLRRLFSAKVNVFLVSNTFADEAGGGVVSLGPNEVFVEVRKRNSGYKYYEFVIDRAVILEKSDALLSDGNLTIVVKIVFTVNLKPSLTALTGDDNLAAVVRQSEAGHRDNRPLLSVHNDLTKVVLIIKGKEIIAYRELLSASPRLAAIFAETNRYQINDIDDERVLVAMLQYMYFKAVDNIEPIANELLSACQRYQLYQLKTQCERTLERKLTPENAFRTLTLAKQNSCTTLMESCLVFMGEHIADMRRTDNWKSQLNGVLKMAKSHIDKRILMFKLANEQFKRCVDAIQKLDK